MKHLALLLSLLPCAAAAQDVQPCDWRANALNIVEPWEENSRTFSNGKVRLALLDTVEPAAGAFHLLIIAPPYDELGIPTCRVLSHHETIGYAALYFKELAASYDPAKGLIFTLPGTIYLPEHSFQNSVRLTLTLNQATGSLIVDQTLGNE